MAAVASGSTSVRRQELLDASIDYIVRHGLADLSLRPLAAAVGTSARLLVYHFGSKEHLIAEALDGVRQRQERQVTEWLDEADEASLRELVERFWSLSTASESWAYGRLFFEAYGLTLIDPSRLPGFLDGAVTPWIELVRSALVDTGVATPVAAALATAVLAAHRGLLLDLFATGDRARVDAAHRLLLTSIESAVQQHLSEEASR